VETRGVTFNRATGTAQTDQPVKFVFPSGNGEAVGVEYHSEEGAVQLLRDVNLFLTPPASNAAAKKTAKEHAQDPVHLTGRSLDFGRDSRTMHLLGPVEAETRMARLLAGELTLMLDSSFRAKNLWPHRERIEKNRS